jgi:cytochrome c553
MEVEMTPELRVLDQAWRRWSVAVVILVIVTAALLGFIVLPVVQGRSAGLDAFTAICRSLGLQAGSPAAKQPGNQAKAQPVSQVAWTAQVIDRLNHPNVKNGSELAASTCAGCHGERGMSPDPQFPNMAGQSAFAIYKQLHDFKSGARANDLMASVVQGLDDEQMADVGGHFAALARGTLDPQSATVDDPDIIRLVERGDPSRGLPACASCHGARAGGPIETPTLTGQRKDYLLAQLQAYASAGRHNDIYARMRVIASKLTPGEVERIAHYYASLGPDR